MPTGFISKTGESEGTELCQASWLPGSTPQHMTVRKNDSAPRAETGVPAFLLNCKADDSKGTELLQAYRLPGSTP